MKRFLADFLTMCMIVSVPAFAEDASRQEPVSEQLIDKEIRERVQYRLDAVSEQLEGVDERYASIYREYITCLLYTSSSGRSTPLWPMRVTSRPSTG